MTLSRDNPLTLFQAVHDTARIVIKKLDAARVGYEDLRSWEPKHNGMQTRSGLYFRLENGFPDTIIMPWGEWTYVKIASCTKYETLVKSILGALSCELQTMKMWFAGKSTTSVIPNGKKPT